MKILQALLARHKQGTQEGIYSLCSSHPVVIEAAMRMTARNGSHLLIEATSNQVNQFGGYTGMTPVDFKQYVATLAAQASLPLEQVLLGGDHLGPNCWQREQLDVALERSQQLVSDYVAAGFRKIHLDCSMSCAGDPAALDDTVIAARAARLCEACEQSWQQHGGEAPVYVIGTEVPTPGGATEELEELVVTTPAAVTATLEAHRAAFRERGLDDAWGRVCALVVQPGVEFDHHKVIDYRPDRARDLSRRIEQEPVLVYEAHSTDYQTAGALSALVQDHFAILKVGPGVTYALRQALWALGQIESELGASKSGESLKEVVLRVMRADPRYWQSYYTDPHTQLLDMQYSLSDRIRYYWGDTSVRQACDALLANLNRHGIPLTLLNQYLPAQYAAVRQGRIANEPRALLLDSVERVLRDYATACRTAAPGVSEIS
jgi:D-tagatose-1,6-bisphosphate aldolase subunit GatZ/KbaZ